LEKYQDVIKQYLRVEQTQVGNIIDAQDYLGNWHLAIVMKANNQDRDIHFLPYSNQKRDEVFSEADSNKIAPVFTNSEVPTDPEQAFI
jgi:hypothetical protein